MRRTLVRWQAFPLFPTVLFCLICALITTGTRVLASPPVLLWVDDVPVDAGGCSASYVARSVDVTTDTPGNVFLTGMFAGTLDFGASQVTAVGDFDAFFARYDAAGTPMWIVRGGGTSSGITQCERGIAAAAAPNGDCVFVGEFYGAATFDTVSVTSAGGHDAFIARFDPAGELLWVRTIGTANTDQARGVAVDAAGNAFVTGITQPVPFAPRAFIARYDASGNPLWYWESTEQSYAWGAGVDDGGNCAFTGSGTLTLPDSTVSGDGFFVAKCTPAGNFLWAFHDGGSGAGSTDLAMTGGGDIYLVCDFTGSLSVGDTTMSSPGYPDGGVVKYDADGVFLWARGLTGPTIVDQIFTSRISVGADDACLASGDFIGTLAVGDTSLYSTPNPMWSEDGFAASFDADGTFRWGMSTRADGFDHGYSVAAAPDGGAVFAGAFPDSATFGDSLVVASSTADVFVAVFGGPTVSAAQPAAAATHLGRPHPNPFNPSVSIPYTLDRAATIRIDVFDVRGALVRKLLSVAQSAGPHRVVWDGYHGDGTPAPSGIYFVRLDGSGVVESRKIVLVK